MSASATSRGREWMRRAVLLAVALVIGVALTELVLRIAGVGSPSYGTTDMVRGWANRPGAKVWRNSEGEAYVEIDGDGLRGSGHLRHRPAGTCRIAVLGDSFTEAVQVAEDKTFSAVLERELGHCPGLANVRAEVLNFGVAGYGTAQELLTLREKVWATSRTPSCWPS